MRRWLLWGGLAALLLMVLLIAWPTGHHVPLSALEAVLREDLAQMRSCIAAFRTVHRRNPDGLAELVAAGYLRFIPIDPLTRSAESWRIVRDADGRMADVHSGSEVECADGSRYCTW